MEKDGESNMITLIATTWSALKIGWDAFKIAILPLWILLEIII